MDKKGRFVLFWMMLGVLGILLIGSFITPFKITLDSIFDRIEESSIENATPLLSCTNSNAPGWMKATCFSLKGFMAFFVLYLLYYWISGMTAGAKSRSPVFSPKYKAMQSALEE